MNFRHFILLLVCLLCFTGSLLARPENKKRILVISSYFPLRENGNQLIASFSDVINQKMECDILVEYMDSESFSKFEEWTSWMQMLLGAYRQVPDVIILLGGEAWSAYQVCCLPAWKEVPVILGAVKNGYIDYEHLGARGLESLKDIPNTSSSFGDFRVTGYYVKDYFDENLQLIKRLQPEIQHVIYIHDNRYSLNFFTPYLSQMVKKAGFEDLHVLYGDELSTMEIVDSIIRVDQSYALLSAGWYTDVNKYPHAYSMLHNELGRYHSKFIYQIFDQGFGGSNYLGGYFVSGKDLGRDIAGLTCDVLTLGFENSPRFQVTPSRPHYHINNKVLKDAGLDASRLPADVIWHNLEPSLWQEYAWEMVMIALFVVFVIGVLCFIVYQKKNKVKYYQEVNQQMKDMTDELIVLRDKAEASNRLKSAFLANMSHEIRTPLNAIVGFSSLMSQTDDRESVQEYSKLVEVNNELLLQLINDILDLSKIEAGQLEFVYSEVDVTDVFHNLEQVYKYKVKEGVRLECVVPRDSYMIHSERNRVTQVVTNFLNNALKFTSTGYIRMGYELREGGVYFFVEDSGKGISDENIPHVFTRFMKFDSFVPGTGLGLSICESIVKHLKGEIGVISKLGVGSTFWFFLPRKENVVTN